MLKEFNLTPEMVEKTLMGFPPYQLGYDRDLAVEHAHLPPIVYPFYKEIFEFQRLLAPEELFGSYLIIFFESNNKDTVRIRNQTGSLNILGLKGRFMRTYPSLVRDFYLYLLLENAHYFDKVVYSVNKDYFDKTDLILYKQNQTVALNILLDSAYAKRYRYQKDFRQGKSPDLTKLQIDLIIGDDLRRPVNNYYLPKQNCVDLVIQDFEKLIQSLV